MRKGREDSGLQELVRTGQSGSEEVQEIALEGLSLLQHLQSLRAQLLDELNTIVRGSNPAEVGKGFLGKDMGPGDLGPPQCGRDRMAPGKGTWQSKCHLRVLHLPSRGQRGYWEAQGQHWARTVWSRMFWHPAMLFTSLFCPQCSKDKSLGDQSHTAGK